MPPGLAPEVIEFFAGDGMKLNLIHYPPAGDAPLGQPRRIPKHFRRIETVKTCAGALKHVSSSQG